MPGGAVLSGHAAAPRPQAGWPPAHRRLHPRHRHVVGVPVRTRAAVLQRTAHTRPDLGPELAALPAAAKAEAAAAVAADAAPRQRPPDDPRLARSQQPVAGTGRRRNDRGLPAEPHEADPARHYLARQRAERGGPAAETGWPRRPATGGSAGSSAALREAVRRFPARPVRQPDLVGPDAAERRPAQLLRVVHQHPGLHQRHAGGRDRKSTRLNSSHVKSSYAVFCLKKKKKKKPQYLVKKKRKKKK